MNGTNESTVINTNKIKKGIIYSPVLNPQSMVRTMTRISGRICVTIIMPRKRIETGSAA